MKRIISIGVEKARVARRRDAVLALRDAADRGDFRRHLGGRQDAAVAGLGALAELDLDHLDLLVGGDGGEISRVETSRPALRQPK